jgi:hypothetical protein
MELIAGPCAQRRVHSCAASAPAAATGDDDFGVQPLLNLDTGIDDDFVLNAEAVDSESNDSSDFDSDDDDGDGGAEPPL